MRIYVLTLAKGEACNLEDKILFALKLLSRANYGLCITLGFS